ncbi:MAG: hypothetical protein K2Y37_22670 [Pirellulales bacterium]|nr:hypothetical protein [Pirellulales bacterium]
MYDSDCHRSDDDECVDCDCSAASDGNRIEDDASSSNGRVQAWIDRWLDASDPSDDSRPTNVASNETPADANDAADGQRIADLAFLHALLETVHQPQADVVAQRVRRVMSAIRARELGPAAVTTVDAADAMLDLQPARRSAAAVVPSWVWPLFSTAAVLLVAAGIYWNSGSQANARAAILRASADAARLADREYRAIADFQNPSGKITRTESRLWVRGGEKCVLEHPWMGGHVTIGNNGSRAWFVPLLGLPSLADDPQQSVWWARKAGCALPDLTVRGLIENLVDDFDLELLPPEALPEYPGMLCQHIRGVRRDPHANRCQVIELWAHPQTGVAQHIVLYWNRPAGLAGPERIQVDLIAERPQPDVWYEPESHPPVYPLPLGLPVLPNL